jgi:hypothetical protein
LSGDRMSPMTAAALPFHLNCSRRRESMLEWKFEISVFPMSLGFGSPLPLKSDLLEISGITIAESLSES